jgi:hypothetical protein
MPHGHPDLSANVIVVSMSHRRSLTISSFTCSVTPAAVASSSSGSVGMTTPSASAADAWSISPATRRKNPITLGSTTWSSTASFLVSFSRRRRAAATTCLALVRRGRRPDAKQGSARVKTNIFHDGCKWARVWIGPGRKGHKYTTPGLGPQTYLSNFHEMGPLLKDKN